MLRGLASRACLGAAAASAVSLRVGSDCSRSSDTTEDRLASLDTWFRTQVKSGVLPGAQLLVIKGGKEVYNGVEGYADVEAKKPMTRDQIFRIYSMSKPVTASLALILAEKGIVNLDEDVAEYLPCFDQRKMRVIVPGGDPENPETEPLKAPLTLRHLLSHTSGLTYAIFGDTFSDKKLREQFTPAELTNWLSAVPNSRMCEAAAAPPLLFQPGKHFHYGLSSDVVGHVLEVASGTSLDTLMQREIFEPLEMVDTGFYCPPEKAHRLAACYNAQPGFRSALLPPNRCAANKLEKSVGLHGGGGLVSTAQDYAKFCRFLLTGEATPGGTVLLSPASLEAMRRNELTGDIASASYDKGAVSNIFLDLSYIFIKLHPFIT